MALLYESQLRSRAAKYAMDSGLYRADSALSKHISKRETIERHDIFLSHAYVDREVILGAALTIEDLGFTVYIDWRNDADLDRNRITYATAKRLRDRMKSSACLLYCATERAENSKWMPWELGYKDGLSGRVAVLPVSKARMSSDAYDGQEYLGIYPYVTKEVNRKGRQCLWVNRSEECYVILDDWLEGKNPYSRR